MLLTLLMVIVISLEIIGGATEAPCAADQEGADTD
jgi:hypothetical protein